MCVCVYMSVEREIMAVINISIIVIISLYCYYYRYCGVWRLQIDNNLRACQCLRAIQLIVGYCL